MWSFGKVVVVVVGVNGLNEMTRGCGGVVVCWFLGPMWWVEAKVKGSG